MILVDRKIREGIRSKRFGIDFSEECVQPASYDLRIGRELWSPQSLAPETPIDLEKTGGGHRIAPYGMAILQTLETQDAEELRRTARIEIRIRPPQFKRIHRAASRSGFRGQAVCVADESNSRRTDHQASRHIFDRRIQPA